VALVPLLYLGVSSIVQDGYADLFVNPVRSYSKLVADELEASDPDQFDRRVVELLDSVMLTGQVQFAEVVDGQRKIHGTLSAAVPRNSRRDDFDFGDHGDEIYYISHPIKRPDRTVVLHLGFDESPTLERIRMAKRRILVAVLTFTAFSIAVAIWLSAVIARPMVRLQEAAKRVASGDVRVQLQMSSSITGSAGVEHHLERMRQTLVGTNERLEREMQEREALECRSAWTWTKCCCTRAHRAPAFPAPTARWCPRVSGACARGDGSTPALPVWSCSSAAGRAHHRWRPVWRPPADEPSGGR